MKNKQIAVSYIFNRLLLAFITIYLPLSSLAQYVSVEVPWTTPIHYTENTVEFLAPAIKGGSYQNGLPLFSHNFLVKKGLYDLSVDFLSFSPATAEDLEVIQKFHIEIGEAPTFLLSSNTIDKSERIQLALTPYVKRSGGIERITSLQINYVYKGAKSEGNEKDYVSSSVLGSGTWYKIAVSGDGVYKLDKSFFESLGIDADNLNPQHVNVYGNAFGRLSETNSGSYIDDLSKNAVLAVGESDGVFNSGDYIAFYGAGPHRWDYAATTGFERVQHIYSDVAHYFIHIDASDPPLRIQTISDNSGTVSDLVTSYSYNAIHEVESVNLVKGGQRWYGELFDGELTQTIPFSVSDIVADDPVTVQYAVASNATTSGNYFQFRYNGNLLASQSMSLGGGDYARNVGQFSLNATGTDLSLSVTFSRANASVKGYLDFIEINARRLLKYSSGQFQFRDLQSVSTGAISQFSISGMSSSVFVWDITNKRQPLAVSGTLSGSNFSFVQSTDSLREFVVFSTGSFLTPSVVGVVQNQNLHALEQKDYVIVTHPNFLAQAERLAVLHEQNGTTTHVVTTEQVYNEFSSGTQDATAIRRMMKMFYDRANGVTADQPKYLLLFGDATYDPKNRVGDNNYYVPTFEVLNSENHIEAMVTDDYFGLLDDNASISGNDVMRIGVGRLLISNNDQAVQQVNKIEHYMKNGSQFYSGGVNSCCTGETGSSFGDWRLNYTLITDDEEAGYFVKVDAEPASNLVKSLYPEMNCDKIYSDAYVQTSSAGGERYPTVFDAITDRIERGSLVVNYIGHGGEVGAAEERIITIPQIQSWANINKLGLFVTATCEFTKFDDPSRVSAGEWVSLNPTGGAIALMTTTRSVYFGVNSNTISAFYDYVFMRDANHDALAFGEIMRLTKNNSDNSNNRRSFNLIGDPALKLVLPRYIVVADSINHQDPLLSLDTVRALSKMHVAGHLEDENGTILTSFNGVVSPTIFDKPKVNQTLQNDPTSPLIDFYTQKNALYKGKATVKNGYFSFEFVVPKDINYNFGRGKLSLYANTTALDASGLDTNFIIGGLNTSAPLDNVGPDISVYLNDNTFVNGGITSETPLLIVEASDEYGINTVGNGVGHDLVAVLDGNTSDPIVLNEYFTADLDSYQSGKIQYTLKNLTVGRHTIEIKVWDVNNNSSVQTLEFVVVDNSDVSLDHVLNYPNPFTTSTKFFFEHNQSCSSLETQIQIYTVSGRLVKTINQLVPTSGFRVEGIEWDGKDDFGDQLAKGVYVYRVSVELPEGGKAEKVEKLVLLK